MLACLEQGLRPARILLTDDGLLAMMSETGVVEVDDAHVVWKGRLGPGVCLTMDLETGAISDNLEVKTGLAKKAPYGEWLRKHRTVVEPGPFGAEAGGELGVNTVEQMTAFGWSMEDLEMQVADMSNGGKETLFSLGNDSPLSVLSQNPSTLYDYFKQRFAQVTNPPIDPLREGVVMNLDMSLGQRYDISRAPAEDLAKQLRVKSPVLNAAVRRAAPHTHTRHPRTPRLRPASTDHPSRRGRLTWCFHRSRTPHPRHTPRLDRTWRRSSPPSRRRRSRRSTRWPTAPAASRRPSRRSAPRRSASWPPTTARRRRCSCSPTCARAGCAVRRLRWDRTDQT